MWLGRIGREEGEVGRVGYDMVAGARRVGIKSAPWNPCGID